MILTKTLLKGPTTMYHAIPYVYEKEDVIYIDVRSQSEYKSGHIIGAINLPILDDLERHEVGFIYKNASVEEAKRVGLKYGSAKLHLFYDTLFKLRNEYPCKKIIFYCARGGYRSRSIALLLRSIDIPVFWLQGGYKGYRNEVLKKLNQSEEEYPNFIVLNGLTGVGKTHILQELQLLGEPVIDLEGAANHRGSNLGAIGTDGHQSVQCFENAVYDQLMRINAPYCFIESESRRIGQVFVPKTMFNKMQSGTFLLITASLAFRIEALMKDYSNETNFKSGISNGLPRIKPFMVTEIYNELINAFNNDDLLKFTELLLVYHYDPLYKKSIESHQHTFKFQVDDYVQCSKEIAAWVTNSFLVQSE